MKTKIGRNIVNLLIVLLCCINIYASSNPVVLISEPDVKVTSFGDLDFFESVNFDLATDDLTFITNREVSVIQIYNDNGDMEFQLPVAAEVVRINKNIFGEGQFKLGFILTGESTVHFTNVTIR